MGVWLWCQTNAQSSQWVGKGLPCPKKAQTSWLKHEGEVDNVFWLEMVGSLWIFSMWLDSKQGVLQGSFMAF